MSATAVFSDAKTNDIIFILDVVRNEQGNNGVEVRHGSGVSTMVGARKPRRITYSGSIVTPGMAEVQGRVARIQNRAKSPVRPTSLLRQVDEQLLGKKVFIDSGIQPHRNTEWAVEFVNAGFGIKDGENVINVEIAVIEEFNREATLEIGTIALPVLAEEESGVQDAGDGCYVYGPPGARVDLFGITICPDDHPSPLPEGAIRESQIDHFGLETMGKGRGCEKANSVTNVIGGAIGVVGGAVAREGRRAGRNIKTAGGAIADAGRATGDAIGAGLGAAGDAFGSLAEGVGLSDGTGNGDDFVDGVKQGFDIGQGKGACL